MKWTKLNKIENKNYFSVNESFYPIEKFALKLNKKQIKKGCIKIKEGRFLLEVKEDLYRLTPISIDSLTSELKKNFNIKESSLSRIKDQVDNHACGAVTAFRGNRSLEENRKLNDYIKSYLHNKGFGVTKIKGSYIENMGTSSEREVGEETLFAVNLKVKGDDGGELERELIRLGERFSQDSILSVRNGKGILIGTNKWLKTPDDLTEGDERLLYRDRLEVGKGRYGKVAGEFLSRIRGREFAFESRETYRSISHRRMVHEKAKRIRQALENDNILMEEILKNEPKNYYYYKEESPRNLPPEMVKEINALLTTILDGGKDKILWRGDTLVIGAIFDFARYINTIPFQDEDRMNEMKTAYKKLNAILSKYGYYQELKDEYNMVFAKI